MTPHPWIERAHALLVSLHREAVELSRDNPDNRQIDNAAAHLTVALSAFEVLLAGNPPKEGRP